MRVGCVEGWVESGKLSQEKKHTVSCFIVQGVAVGERPEQD